MLARRISISQPVGGSTTAVYLTCLPAYTYYYYLSGIMFTSCRLEAYLRTHGTNIALCMASFETFIIRAVLRLMTDRLASVVGPL